MVNKMKKIIMFFILLNLLVGCSTIRYYEQYEFLIKYDELIREYNKTLERPMTRSQLKKLDKKFRMFERQLYEENDNYIRINEEIVNSYSKDIRYYRGIIEDLKD